MTHHKLCLIQHGFLLQQSVLFECRLVIADWQGPPTHLPVARITAGNAWLPPDSSQGRLNWRPKNFSGPER